MTNPTRLLDEYRFPGFCPRSALAVHPTDPTARVIELVRHKKKRRLRLRRPTASP